MKWETQESGDRRKGCIIDRGMWYRRSILAMSDLETLMSKADSALLFWVHMCVSLHVVAVISPPHPYSTLSPPLSHSSLTSTSAVPLSLIPSCAGWRDARSLLFCPAAGSAPASLVPFVCSLPASSLCLPLWGLLASPLPWLLLLLVLEQWSCLTLRRYAATALPRFSSLPLASHSALLDNHR